MGGGKLLISTIALHVKVCQQIYSIMIAEFVIIEIQTSVQYFIQTSCVHNELLSPLC